MKLTLTTDDGELLGVVEHVEGYDLNKPIGAAGFLDDIRSLLPQHIWDDSRRNAERQQESAEHRREAIHTALHKAHQ